jgi:hypothetical protein
VVQQFIANLTQIHASGVTITMTMGSWCTSFPLKEWSAGEFSSFVSYFKTLRAGTFGGQLDGIDFDWEGFCGLECLQDRCTCGWDDPVCGVASPEELAGGVNYTVKAFNPGDKDQTFECFAMPTTGTLQVITGIAHYMK